MPEIGLRGTRSGYRRAHQTKGDCAAHALTRCKFPSTLDLPIPRQSDAMEMHQVRYFLAVAEELNFTRAAEKCNVSQPSLSRAIQMLEQEFGGPLFWRERGRTHLTELGQMIRPH